MLIKDLDPVCLMGPTGSGKSALALRLAEILNAEIITVDSAQVYTGMDIGTAKPTRAERAQVRHHLLDVCDPVDHYSVAQFVSDATALIQQVQEGGKRPLLVGGTMLYFRALQTGLAHLPSRDEQLRDSLTLQAKLKGWPALHAELTTVDPVSASRIQPNDGQRIQRALEVYLLTGQTLSSLQTQQLKTQTWTFPKFILAPLARENLRLPLEQRLRLMWRAGFVEEVMALRERGDLSLDKPALRSVGYRQIWQALDGLHSMETAQQLSLQATMALAKRQYTWLRQEPDACWLAPDDAQIISRITQFLAS